MYPIQNLPNELTLGRQREQNVTAFVFDISAWLAKWPGLVCHITHAQGGNPYPVTGVVQDGDTLTWTVGGDCTQASGYGSMVVTGVVDDKRVCSACAGTRVLAGHATAGDPPAPVADWLEDYTAKWGSVDVTVEGLPEGASPTASVEQDEGGTHLALGVPKGDKGNVMFATFAVVDGRLIMTTPDGYTGPTFQLNGNRLEVVI